MGHFLTPVNITGKEYIYSQEKHDWFLGNLKENFPYKIDWYESDSINWQRKCSGIPRVAVRRWCERILEGDIFVFDQSNSEFRYLDEKNPLDGGYQVTARWVSFHFEFETDAMAFKLRWLKDG